LLNGCVDEFRAADYEAREEIVGDFLGSFESTCPQGVKFDGVAVRTVRAPLATLGWSQKFLAYSAAHLWQNQTGNKEIRSRNPKSDG
jgi:hypothetical protein